MSRRSPIRPLSSVRPTLRAPSALLLLSLVAAGCTDADPTGPEEVEVAELTIDAADGWAFATLGDPGQTVSVSDPAASTAWDLAFFATGVMLNGGAAGPGGVEGYCLCQNAGASEAEIIAMTPESELSDFQEVSAARIPSADSLWKSDVLAPSIRDWYAYDLQTHTVSADSSRAWLVRTAESEPSFAKLRVRSLDGAARSHAGTVMLEYALQPAEGAPMGETRTLEVDLSTGGRVYVDLRRGEVSDASDWDLALEGYTIRLNSGVSGSGGAGAVLADSPFAEIEDAGSAPATVYRADAYGGVFDAHRWYHYDLENHQVWPTYDVYLVRRGSEVYKVQITGYYGRDGSARQVTFRYAPLTD